MKQSFIIVLIAFFFFSLITQSVLAASTTMEASPSSGSFDKSFTVSLVIDGHGERFNAAEATITIPSNIQIENLVLGDCNFSFLKTPSTEQPSFQGILLSQYASKCTVYRLTLIPAAKGEGSITLSDASVKRFGDATDILSSIKHGRYTLTGISQTKSTEIKKANQTNNNLYSVILNIFSQKDEPVNKATIRLSPVEKKDEIKGTTDENGIVHFADVKSGVYSIVVEKDNKKIGETIINISGPQHVLTLSIDLDAQKNNPLLKNSGSFLDTFMISPLLFGLVLVIGIVLGTILLRFINKFRDKRHT